MSTAAAVILAVLAVAIIASIALLARRPRERSRRREAELLAELDPRAELNDSTHRELAAAVARLPDPEKLVLSLTYFEAMSDSGIGEVLAIDAEAVAPIREQAIKRLAGVYRRRPEFER